MQTRRHLFKSSVLSAFGLMSAPAVVQAAAHARGVGGACSAASPILIRPDKGAPVLLVPRADGKVEARYLNSKGGEPLVSPLRLRELTESTEFSLSPVEGDITVHGKPIKIKNGLLEVPIDTLKTSDLGFNEIQFGEIYWIEGPHSTPPLAVPGRKR
jgi:hypothetical protein